MHARREFFNDSRLDPLRANFYSLATMISRFSLPLCVLLLLVLAGPLAAEPLGLAPQEGLLLLRSGGVLRGQITRAGDHYYVAFPDAEIRVKAADVELHCRDLDEAYQLKSSVLKPGQADQRLQLAQWCLRQGLLGYAARELMHARAEDPRNPRLELVERRLRTAANPSNFELTSPTEPALRASGEQLDQWASGLPPGAVATFTNVVQPLLLNGCATGGCHGPAAENQLRMERTAGGRPLTRSITHRNLQAVLACIDEKDAAASALLTKPLAPHGGASRAIFAAHDLEQYQQLVAWVQAISRQPPVQAASVDRTAGPLLQALHATRMPQQAHPVSTESAQPEVDPAAATAPLDAEPTNPQVEEPARLIQRGVPPAKPLVTDPFDPAIFNRQFSGR